MDKRKIFEAALREYEGACASYEKASRKAMGGLDEFATEDVELHLDHTEREMEYARERCENAFKDWDDAPLLPPPSLASPENAPLLQIAIAERLAPLGAAGRAAYYAARAAPEGEPAELALVRELNRYLVYAAAPRRVLCYVPHADAPRLEIVTAGLARLALGTLAAEWATNRPVSVYDVWARSAESRSVERYAFCPPTKAGAEPELPPGVYNTWQGCGIPPPGGSCQAKGAVAFVLAIRAAIGRREAQNRALADWCAHLAQRPGDEKIGWAPVFACAKGGDDGIYRALSAVIGAAYCRRVGSDEELARLALGDEAATLLLVVVAGDWSPESFAARRALRILMESRYTRVLIATGRPEAFDARHVAWCRAAWCRFLILRRGSSPASPKPAALSPAGDRDVAALLYSWAITSDLQGMDSRTGTF